jgi:AcrR family transcriptional regulator
MSVEATGAAAAPAGPTADRVEQPAPRKQGQARRDELRATVLEAVERHLRAGARYADLNVIDVVKEVGISRSTFYAYFIDKPTLLRTWYAEFHGALQEAAEEWWSLDGTATRADLKRALGRVMAATRSHPELLAATHDAIGTDERVRDAVRDAMQVYIDRTREHIEAGQAAGFVDPSLPPAETAHWLQWMAERALHMMGRRSGNDLDRMLEAHTAIVWNTLYAPVRRPAAG